MITEIETTETKTAKPARAVKNLKVVCPFCLSGDSVKLDLNQLDSCECECGETFSPREAAEKFAKMAAKWAAVAEWVEAAPAL